MMSSTPALREQPFQPSHVLVAGAHGVAGALVVASLLRATGARITGLVAPGQAPGALVRDVARAWERQSGTRWSAAVEARLAWRTQPQDPADLADLAPALADVDEIVHCANVREPRLQRAAVWFTAHLMLLARRLSPRRLVHLAGRCSCAQPCTGCASPTERLVAAAGVPYVVIRPSPQPRPRRRTLGHQDAFCSAFTSAHRWLADGARAPLAESGLPVQAPHLPA